jgi:DNA (cytosine-5)-methyltransferase 1
MKFIDLFAGLGGFHLALKQLGHICVFASEVNPTLQDLYEKNFGIKPAGDIKLVVKTQIPSHDILCAGFPCQPFSKAGRQDGLSDPKLGNLYKEIIEVIKECHPTYFILENVPNFELHDNKNTWKKIKELLEKEEYTVEINKFSPHQFGIPQIRERVYIIGYSRGKLQNFKWPNPVDIKPASTLLDYLDTVPREARRLPDYLNKCLDIWQEFLDRVPSDEKLPNPLWSMEFGATYPYQKTTPNKMAFKNLKKYKGTHGIKLSAAQDKQELMLLLPSHARREQDIFPKWKIKYIKKNRAFYNRHQNWLDDWIPEIHKFASSLQKMEWNCQGEENRRIREYILQVRPSGIRVKRRTNTPSLVAMTATQVPIIAWEDRYVTPNECKKLQSMDGKDGLKYLPQSETKAYEALGNAINVRVAKRVAEALLVNS